MAHKLETSILNLSALIEKHTGDKELVNIARSLASWSSNYTPIDNNWKKTDQPYETIHKLLMQSVKDERSSK